MFETTKIFSITPKVSSKRLINKFWSSLNHVIGITQLMWGYQLIRYNRKDWHCIEVRSLRLAKSNRNTQHQEPINLLLTTLCHQCVVSRLLPMYGMVWSSSGLRLVNLVPRALFPGFINAIYKTLEGELEYSDTNADVTYWWLICAN